jgi:hypothetical protein
MSLPRALGLITMLSLVGASSAAAQLPVGEADGVRIVRDRQGAIVVKFTPRAAKLWRRMAGRRVSVFCTDLPAPGSNGDVIADGGTTFRAPKRGRTLRTGDLTRGLDYCRVLLARRPRRPLVSIPLTQTGAVHLDERAKAVRLTTILSLAKLVASEEDLAGYPTHAQLTDFLASLRPRPIGERMARGIVALATPAATPPAGKVGYYSDGIERVAVVVLSRSARRLFVEFESGGVLRTNVAGFIFGDEDF